MKLWGGNRRGNINSASRNNSRTSGGLCSSSAEDPDPESSPPDPDPDPAMVMYIYQVIVGSKKMFLTNLMKNGLYIDTM
jgi:hypothetical protein